MSIGEGKGFSRWLCRLCPVGTARTDVALFTAVSLDISVRACVCVKERGHEEDRQKERVRGRGRYVKLAKLLSKTDLFGNCWMVV